MSGFAVFTAVVWLLAVASLALSAYWRGRVVRDRRQPPFVHTATVTPIGPPAGEPSAPSEACPVCGEPAAPGEHAVLVIWEGHLEPRYLCNPSDDRRATTA